MNVPASPPAPLSPPRVPSPRGHPAPQTRCARNGPAAAATSAQPPAGESGQTSAAVQHRGGGLGPQQVHACCTGRQANRQPCSRHGNGGHAGPPRGWNWPGNGYPAHTRHPRRVRTTLRSSTSSMTSSELAAACNAASSPPALPARASAHLTAGGICCGRRRLGQVGRMAPSSSPVGFPHFSACPTIWHSPSVVTDRREACLLAAAARGCEPSGGGATGGGDSWPPETARMTASCRA